MTDDWMARVRAKVAGEDALGFAFVTIHIDAACRLLACAEALRELVALRDNVGALPGQAQINAAWEQARMALG